MVVFVHHMATCQSHMARPFMHRGIIASSHKHPMRKGSGLFYKPDWNQYFQKYQ